MHLQCRRSGRGVLAPRVRKIPWRKAWQRTQDACLQNPVDVGAWCTAVYGVTESDTTEQLGTKGPAVKSTCSSRHSVIHPEHMECLSWKCQHTARCGKDEYKHTVSVLKERNLWGEGTGTNCKLASIKIELKRIEVIQRDTDSFEVSE